MSETVYDQQLPLGSRYILRRTRLVGRGIPVDAVGIELCLLSIHFPSTSGLSVQTSLSPTTDSSTFRGSPDVSKPTVRLDISIQ